MKIRELPANFIEVGGFNSNITIRRTKYDGFKSLGAMELLNVFVDERPKKGLAVIQRREGANERACPSCPKNADVSEWS